MSGRVVLQSWKEISAHVGRTERTLQRWEQEFAFPVHRPSGKSRSAVVAVVSEIEEWMRARPSLPDIRKNANFKPVTSSHRNHGSNLDAGEERTQRELDGFHVREPFNGTNGSAIVPGLESTALRVRDSIEKQINLCTCLGNLLEERRNLTQQQRSLTQQQRTLLEQQRSLRQQLRSVRRAAIR